MRSKSSWSCIPIALLACSLIQTVHSIWRSCKAMPSLTCRSYSITTIKIGRLACDFRDPVPRRVSRLPSPCRPSSVFDAHTKKVITPLAKQRPRLFSTQPRQVAPPPHPPPPVPPPLSSPPPPRVYLPSSYSQHSPQY